MAMLLRKVWHSVSNRSGSSSDFSPSDCRSLVGLPMGDLDRIPSDILMQILRLVGPKDAARLCIVCKALKVLVSDNHLWVFFLQKQKDPWDSIFFGETNFAFGYPLQASSSLMPEISFMRIYSKRAQVPGSVIIDGGSGYCKFGRSKYACPSGRSATFLEFGNIESPMYSRLRHFFTTIYTRMRVKASLQPVVLSLPIIHYDGKRDAPLAPDKYNLRKKLSILRMIVAILLGHENIPCMSAITTDDTESAKASRQQLKDAIHSVLFDMNVPAVCAINQATLALYAAGRTSGIVVNVGFQVTSVVPILHGKVMRKVGVEVVGLGALKITGYLRELMMQNGIYFETMYTVRTLKEKLCYVAFDYEAELSKDTRASYEASGEGWFTLSKERFQTGEILFQPRIAGVRAMGLHQAVALCMDHCYAAEVTGDDSWFKTVVLAGGSACLPGLAERLHKELCGLLPPSMSNGIKVIPPPNGAETAWFGAKLISNLSGFPGSWCKTKKQFKQRPRLSLKW